MRRGWLGYAANASDWAFFTSAICNTRLHKRSVNRVLSMIEAWLDGSCRDTIKRSSSAEFYGI